MSSTAPLLVSTQEAHPVAQRQASAALALSPLDKAHEPTEVRQALRLPERLAMGGAVEIDQPQARLLTIRRRLFDEDIVGLQVSVQEADLMQASHEGAKGPSDLREPVSRAHTSSKLCDPTSDVDRSPDP